ncbi:MAG TPA: ParB/RepB/Spo0J family partition protein [Oligoflexia bacterium]|nr:ParB/RepB/Spo0J family partition protein [Oligoflexia bacterium]HMP26835.1 ParB/RepB/Spo0J family partition protein [Oligoflexia bacterium]
MKNVAKKGGKQVLGRGLSSLISTPIFSNPVPVSVKMGTKDENTTELQLKTLKNGEDNLINSKIEVTEQNHFYNRLFYLPLNEITNNPKQPRQSFSESELNELIKSIKQNGVLQPILVRPNMDQSNQDFKYQIVAGERRWRASKEAGLKTIPCLIFEIDDKAALEIALVENVQRADLNPIEIARGYEKLLNDFSMTLSEISERVGREPSTISNFIRLLKLPQEVVVMVETGTLTMGHARAILTIKEPSAQISLAKKVIAENLSVRALETIVSRVVVLDKGSHRQMTKRRKSIKEGAYPEICERLRSKFATKVSINSYSPGKGKIEIEFFSEGELERLVELMDPRD